MHESVLDQISPLIELKRWLCQLSVMSQPPNVQKPVTVEMLPEVISECFSMFTRQLYHSCFFTSQIRSSILSKYHRKWKKLAKHQSKSLFNNDIQYIKTMAQVLSEAYDLDKLDSVEPKKCFACQDLASKRCSKCKEAWYCGRYVQISICYSNLL